jgi:hypothetical protein
VTFCGSEKAEEILRFSTCFEKVTPFEFWKPFGKFVRFFGKKGRSLRHLESQEMSG